MKSRQEGKIVGTRKIKWSSIAMGKTDDWRRKKKLDVSFILVEKEGDIRHVSNWKEGKDCYACQCSLKKSLKSCAEKQWRWTDKRQMQLKDRHDGDARFSEIREKRLFCREAGQTEGVFILEEVSQPLFFFDHSVCVMEAEGHGVKGSRSQIWNWIISDFSGLTLQWLSDISKS